MMSHGRVTVPTVVVEEYDQHYSCMTVEELRWLFHHLERHSKYYIYFLLRVTLGIRGRELLNVQLAQFRDNYTRLIYIVDKPKNVQNRRDEWEQRHKIRDVTLPEWVRGELVSYLERHMVVQKHADGSRTYLSPFNTWQHHGLLFDIGEHANVLSYWSKLRKKMALAGHDSLRLDKRYVRLRSASRIMEDHVYILRPHILRHVYATVRWYQLGQDIKRVQKDIRHSKGETTHVYIHSAEELGTTPEFLRLASWPEILGFNDRQLLLKIKDLSQTNLSMY